LTACAAATAGAETYRDLALAYARGDLDAVDRLSSRSRTEVRTELKWLREMRACAQCGERELADRFPFLGAALLHTDRALRDDETGDTGSRDFHLGFALELLEAGPAEGQRWEPAWFLVVGHHFLRYVEPPEAHRYFRAGLSRFPTDARFRIGEGAAFEQEARLAPPPDFLYSETAVRRRLGDLAERHAALARAEAEFRRAIEVVPESAEARLRRGRVLIDLERRDEAARELSWVMDHVPSGDLRALATLFRGLAEDKAGRLEAAARWYREARTASPPGSRAAAVALAHALDRLGSTAEAQALVDELLARPAERDRFDTYITGPADEMETLVAELRAAAREAAR